MNPLTRSDVPVEETWSVESVYANAADWRVALAAVILDALQMSQYAGRLAESGATLLDALELRDALSLRARRMSMWPSLLSSVDAGNALYASMNGEAAAAVAKLAAAAAFVDPELLQISTERMAALLHEAPGLQRYAHAFAVLSAKAMHVRNAESEAVLAQVAEPLESASVIASAATYADMRFAPVLAEDGKTNHALTHSSAGGLLAIPELRHATWNVYADGHIALENTLAAAYQGTVKATIFRARARRYKSALAMSLAENHIPESVFDALQTVFDKNLPTWHRFWALRQRRLGRVQRNSDAPVYGGPSRLGPEMPMTFAQASDMIAAAMAPLGVGYVQAMLRGLREDRWVDRAKNTGKIAGAFSSGVQGTRPFILMSWNDSLLSASTLAHELGHSMHTLLSCETQPAVYSDYGLFVAEVASNFNQAMMRAHLLKTAHTADQRLSILDEAFSNFHRYLFVMPLLARFERDVFAHVEAGGAISAPFLSNRFADVFRAGYGGAMEIDAARLGAGWMAFSHLHSPFYVYQYGTGIAAANALARDVLEQGAPAAARVTNFLKAGASGYPLEVLNLAGIDMTTHAPIERGFAMLKDMVDELEANS